MKAKVTTAFPGRPDDEVLTRTIAEGEEIEGDLARVACENKWAKEIKAKADSKPAAKSGGE